MDFWAVLGPLGPNFGPQDFFSGLFVKPAVKHNGNELEYANSAKSNVVNLRKQRKIQFLGQFGPVWTHLVHFRAKTFFFSKIQKRHFSTLIKG